MGSNEAAVVAQYDAVWLDANRFYDAESRYYQVSDAESKRRANPGHSPPSKQSTQCLDKKLPVERKQNKGVAQSSLASEIAYARQKIQNFLKSGDPGVDSGAGAGASMLSRLEKLEQGYEAVLIKLEQLTIEVQMALSAKQVSQTKETSQVPKKEDSKVKIQNGSSAADNDDDIDLFGSDEEDDAAAVKVREERLQAYANKKSKKPALVAKSSVVLDVKPWDDETDMKEMEKAVRAVQSDGLVWGASKLVPLAYGINKLQIVAVVEDEKVSIDWLQETICEIEDLVQSVDIAAFNKL